MPIIFGSAEAQAILQADIASGGWMTDVADYGGPAPRPEYDHCGNYIEDMDDDDEWYEEEDGL